MKNSIRVVLLLSVTAFAFFLRTYNLNWDAGTHIHPDERFLTMVTNDLRLPNSFADYLNPQVSPMNPHNINYGFFVYGTFPIYLVKILALWLRMDNYGDITILGRFVSAIFDTGIVILLYLLSKKLSKAGILTALLPSFIYSIMVLPIQLSHFFAVDTFLVFFMITSTYIHILIREYMTKQKWGIAFTLSLIAGITVGLGLACKVTMLFIMPLNFLLIFTSFFNKRLKFTISVLFQLFSFFIVIFIAYLSFRLAQPMAFSDANFLNFALNQKWIQNLKDLQDMSSSALSNTFPPAIQWFTTKPIIYPFINMILWGMGIPLGILVVISFIYTFIHALSKTIKTDLIIFLISLFSFTFFIYQGVQFSKAMRYFYPIYWCLALSTGYLLKNLNIKIKSIAATPRLFFIFYFLFFISLLVYPVSFLQIYTRPHSRIAASRWIYAHIPAGSKVTFEEWDDPLPLLIDGHFGNEYPGTALPMFWPDSEQKWQAIDGRLQQADYLILSSNRVYGSIPRRTDIFPQTVKFYQDLFSDKLNFRKVTEFTSQPTIPFLNYKFNDDNADESFTVYDHPKVMIFKKL